MVRRLQAAQLSDAAEKFARHVRQIAESLNSLAGKRALCGVSACRLWRVRFRWRNVHQGAGGTGRRGARAVRKF